jgi:hypothetical protein
VIYRKKILLALIGASGNGADPDTTRYLLFLMTRQQETPAYDFVPGKQGPFSYTAEEDLRTLIEKDLVKVHNGRVHLNSEPQELKGKDPALLHQLVQDHRDFTIGQYLQMIALWYPYWLINCSMASGLLSSIQWKKVSESRPVSSKTSLYTIGYEGISIETYFNRLLEKDVKLLADVRRNAFSHKFGFSRNNLQNCCNELNIIYIHIPELGIASAERKQVQGSAGKNGLFLKYQEDISAASEKQQYILELLREHKRIALTCFEADPCDCHRSRLALALGKRDSSLVTEHL